MGSGRKARWQHSSQLRIPVYFWYLTKTNTGERPVLFIHDLALILKESKPSVLRMLNGDSIWGNKLTPSVQVSFCQTDISVPDGPDSAYAKWSSDTSDSLGASCHIRAAPECARGLAASHLAPPEFARSAWGKGASGVWVLTEKQALPFPRWKSHWIHTGPGKVGWCICPFPGTKKNNLIKVT